MALKHPRHNGRGPRSVEANPLFSREPVTVARYEMPRRAMDPDTAYQLVHDELMLDGNARLNLATFVSTWMEPQALRLMSECADKNMIDKDEYPQTAELETRCVQHARPAVERSATPTTRRAAPRPGPARRRCSPAWR